MALKTPRPNAANFPPPVRPAPRPHTDTFVSGLDGDAQFVEGESTAGFCQLRTEYEQRFQPRTPEERFHMDSLIRNEWILRRLFRAEAHLWEYHIIRSDPSEGVLLGAAFDKASPVFMRLQRRITLAERSYKEAFDELQRLQAARVATQPAVAPQPVAEPAETLTTASETATTAETTSTTAPPIPVPAPKSSPLSKSPDRTTHSSTVHLPRPAA